MYSFNFIFIHYSSINLINRFNSNTREENISQFYSTNYYSSNLNNFKILFFFAIVINFFLLFFFFQREYQCQLHFFFFLSEESVHRDSTLERGYSPISETHFAVSVRSSSEQLLGDRFRIVVCNLQPEKLEVSRSDYFC